MSISIDARPHSAAYKAHDVDSEANCTDFWTVFTVTEYCH